MGRRPESRLLACISIALFFARTFSLHFPSLGLALSSPERLWSSYVTQKPSVLLGTEALAIKEQSPDCSPAPSAEALFR